MTKEQTIKVLQLLNAFYAGGKNDPKKQVTAWYMILAKYDFEDAMKAVLDFAENDKRDYATFPAVGVIVDRIKTLKHAEAVAVRDIIHSISYGRDYASLPDTSKVLISEDLYNEWSKIDAEEFAQKAGMYTNMLKHRQLAQKRAQIGE